MARRTILADDLDGSEADVSTVSFSIDGSNYEIDLSADNQGRLNETLAPYVEAARSVGGGSGRRARGTAASEPAPRRHVATDVDPKAVRAWAASQGIEVSSRGRIPGSIVEQFRAAGN